MTTGRLSFILFGLFLAVGQGALAGTPLVVDRDLSSIKIDVKATIGSFVGHLANYEAVIHYDSESEAVSSADIRFRFADVTTGEDKRDRHMHDWQETESFPDGRFVLNRLEMRSGGGGEATAFGELTLHQRTQKLEFPVSILIEDRTVVIDGNAVLDTQDFGLPIIRKFLALKVDPLVTIQFHLHTTRAEDG